MPNDVKDTKLKEILDKHAKVFESLGKLKGHKVQLHIDKGVTPKAQQVYLLANQVQNFA